MKGLSQVELEVLVQEMESQLIGAQLQEVQVGERTLVYSFYREKMKWLVVDLHNNAPMALLYEAPPPLKKAKQKKPLGLFLNSHIKGRYLQQVQVLSAYGRVFVMNFGEDRLVETRLIPKQINVLISSQGKGISWNKPLPLSPPPEGNFDTEVRSFRELRAQWEGATLGKSSSVDPRVLWEKQKQKDLEKKKKALGAILENIQSAEEHKWRQLGESLKETGELEGVAPEVAHYVDFKQSLNWNIENAFVKAKQLAQKKEGALERFKALEMEIRNLEMSTYSPKVSEKAPDLMRQASAKGRKLHLDSGVIVYCGKSAADNLALLRRARAWDLWLHLKDYPGAHAIIHKNKDQVIAEGDLSRAAEWVVKESFASKKMELGARLDIVIVECRFVRPIKGDKLGRVNYHSEKTYSFTVRH